MSRPLPLGCLLALALAPLAAQAAAGSTAGTAGQAGATAVPPAVRAQILRTDRQWGEAEKRRDEQALRRILSDNFIAVYASGRSVDKEGFIKDVIGNELNQLKSQSASDIELRVDGDTAVLSEVVTLRGTDDGQPYVNASRLTTTYVRRSGRWRALAERFGRAVDLAADEAAVRRADADWVKAAQSGQVNQWLWFYTDDVVVLPPNDAVANGKEAARKSVAGLLALPNLAIVWQPTKVEVAKSGDIAYVVGVYDISYRDATGKTASDHGKLLEVWKKQVGGDWKCSVDTWNSDLPAS